MALVQDPPESSMSIFSLSSHPTIFWVSGGVSPLPAFWHFLGFGPLCHLLALGGVDIGWGVRLSKSLGLGVRVWAVERDHPGPLQPVGRTLDPPLGLRLTVAGQDPGV